MANKTERVLQTSDFFMNFATIIIFNLFWHAQFFIFLHQRRTQWHLYPLSINFHDVCHQLLHTSAIEGGAEGLQASTKKFDSIGTSGFSKHEVRHLHWSNQPYARKYTTESLSNSQLQTGEPHRLTTPHRKETSSLQLRYRPNRHQSSRHLRMEKAQRHRERSF